MTIICPKCELELRPRKNGVPVEAMATFGPYQLWMADLFACPECGLEVVTRFAPLPLVEHYEREYAAQREKYPPVCRFWINAQERRLYEAQRDAEAAATRESLVEGNNR